MTAEGASMAHADRVLFRPPAVTPERPVEARREDDPDRLVELLLREQHVCVMDHYGTGAEVLARLKAISPVPERGAPYQERVAAKRAYELSADCLLVPVKAGRLALSGARPNGFVEELYPDDDVRWVPLTRIQAMHAAWGRYRTGVHLNVLGHRLHPYFGVYAPKRMEHLELLATWLSRWSGARETAVDVGTGCGVIGFLLGRAGFVSVVSTDINPNAIESVRRDCERLSPSPPIHAVHGDLLTPVTTAVDLIVFNPPWLPGATDAPFDAALFGDSDLMERFFDQCEDRLAADGRIAVVYSNVGSLVRPDLPHPIERELTGQSRFVLDEKLSRRIKRSVGRRKEKGRTRERVEVWVLRRA